MTTMFAIIAAVLFTDGQSANAPVNASDSLHGDCSSKHVHAANEPDLAGALGRELDDDRLVERQRAADVQ